MLNGEIIIAKVSDMNETDIFLQNEGITYALSIEEVSEKPVLGDEIEGFVYEDKDKKLRFTLDIPDVRLDAFAWASVVEVRRDLGVFVDIGLKNKDIVVSMDDLPEGYQNWPKKGDQLYLKLIKDKKNRLWGQLTLEEDLALIRDKAGKHLMNYNVEARVYRVLNVGVQVFTSQKLLGFIHESEMMNPLRLGELAQGRIIDVHSDGRVNISTRPRAYQALEDDGQMIMALLEKSPSHYIPLHDKSDPELIKDYLGISKGQFKRALGGLLKEGLVKQVIGDGVYLMKDLSDKQ